MDKPVEDLTIFEDSGVLDQTGGGLINFEINKPTESDLECRSY
jgi:hypothetical protein